MQKTVLIRSAVPKDFLEIAGVHVKAWQESYKGILSQDYLNSLSVEQRFMSRKSYKNIETFVAVVDEKIVGFCDVGRTKQEIFTLYILDDFKRQGIGKTLLRHAFNGHDFLDAWVLVENKPARAFYEKQGGCVIDEREDRIGEDAVFEVLYWLKKAV